MNFFNKSRFLTWTLVFLVAVNLTVLAMLLFSRNPKPPDPSQTACNRSCMALQKELTLTEAQTQKVDAILADYRSSTDTIVAKIRDNRAKMLEELAKETPDTVLVTRCTEEIAVMQKELQQAAVKQYLALKLVCTPDQCRKLSALYFELYGCQARTGNGNMNRHRHGQGRSQ